MMVGGASWGQIIRFLRPEVNDLASDLLMLRCILFPRYHRIRVVKLVWMMVSCTLCMVIFSKLVSVALVK